MSSAQTRLLPSSSTRSQTQQVCASSNMPQKPQLPQLTHLSSVCCPHPTGETSLWLGRRLPQQPGSLPLCYRGSDQDSRKLLPRFRTLPRQHNTPAAPFTPFLPGVPAGKIHFILKPPTTTSLTSSAGKKHLYDAQGRPIVDLDKKMVSLHGTWLLTRSADGSRIAEVKPSKKSECMQGVRGDQTQQEE